MLDIPFTIQKIFAMTVPGIPAHVGCRRQKCEGYSGTMDGFPAATLRPKLRLMI
jgi:hypothetical protein